jgi:orotate phosphoribosyltransferase
MDSAVDSSREFVDFAYNVGVLRFGAFKTKAGRVSPYFFDAGLFNDGNSLAQLGDFYARTILGSGICFDMLFGPAYKGIPLVAAVSIAMSRLGRNVPFLFNRKETKDHGEGGTLVGADPKGRILIIDDVVSAGTSVRESVQLIRDAGAVPCGVVIALDRMERGLGDLSAAQEIERHYGMPVLSIADLDDLVDYLALHGDLAPTLQAVASYRATYGVAHVAS